MSYVALYRAYRPQNFTDVAGQEIIVQTLKNAVLTKKIGHAYIFSGPRGTGKTSLAKIFAKAINCENQIDGNPCNNCDSCNNINSSSPTDVIEIDGASNNGVDEIRELRDKVKYLPSSGKYKVYIIDEVHMLTTGAFNALLKTLEEPPAHVVFILATTEVYKIPATIISRCQRYDFKNIDLNNIIKRVNQIVELEDIKIDSEAVETIATNAQGGLRDALSLLDQAVSFTNDVITAEEVNLIVGSVSKKDLVNLLEHVSSNKPTEALKLINDFLSKGKEEERIVNDLILTLRDILLSKVGFIDNEIYSKLSKKLSVNKIYHYLDVLVKTQSNMRFSHQKRIYLEIAIIQLVEHEDIHKIDLSTSIMELRDEIENLKVKGVTNKKVKKEKTNPLVKSSDIEDVLYEASKEVKEQLEDIILNTKVSSYLELTMHLLKATEVAAASNRGVVLTHKDLNVATELMQDEMRKQVLEILNSKTGGIKEVFVILDSDWQIVRTRYVDLFKSGQKRPSIGDYDFKIYEIKEKIKEIKKEKESVRLAKEFFGEEIVKIKE